MTTIYIFSDSATSLEIHKFINIWGLLEWNVAQFIFLLFLRITSWTPTPVGVCLLHFNELPYQHIDGQTAGPKSFTGPIGQQLICCEKPIDCVIPLLDRDFLLHWRGFRTPQTQHWHVPSSEIILGGWGEEGGLLNSNTISGCNKSRYATGYRFSLVTYLLVKQIIIVVSRF